MSGLADLGAVRDQYRDAHNLNSRIDLHTRFSVNTHGWFRWVFDRLPFRDVACLLDLGCGAGKLWMESLARIPDGWSICLADFSSGMLDDARQALAPAARRFAYLVADAQQIPMRTGGLDGVIANHMLYHVADRPRALTEIARVLAADGCLIASTVGDRHLIEIDDCLRAVGVASEHLGHAVSAPFSLENGGAQLEHVFQEVEVYRYDDALRVTEVEPLMAYVQSMVRAGDLPADVIAHLRDRFAREIAAAGAVHLTKDSGLFIARGKRRGA